jgi:ubiquinone/menaquinone biosynthesis C-methylase UbiE
MRSARQDLSKPMLDHFELLAPYYDRIFQGGRFLRRDLERLMAYVGPEPGHRLLDIGGGTGRIAQHFCGRVAQVCVLDPSPGMLREGQRKGICITRGESEDLPFAGAVFDRIILVDAFHHLRDQERAAREIVRVLAPGGRLVIQEPDIAHWAVKLVALGEKVLLMRSRFYAPEEIGAILSSAGDRVAATRIVCVDSDSTRSHTAWVVVEKA